MVFFADLDPIRNREVSHHRANGFADSFLLRCEIEIQGTLLFGRFVSRRCDLNKELTPAVLLLREAHRGDRDARSP